MKDLVQAICFAVTIVAAIAMVIGGVCFNLHDERIQKIEAIRLGASPIEAKYVFGGNYQSSNIVLSEQLSKLQEMEEKG